ncbi:MAG: hypothetical protein JXB17_02275, partial [Bacteroidales bacterium]|nr:hypothetical protein [Bacteroidales bacterium]
MRILIISATQFECQFIEKKFQNFELVRGIKRFKNNECTIDLLIAGIGIPSTIYNLLKTIKSNNYDFVLNTGIAGAFKKLNKGDVVHVISDEFADIGFENKDGFITVFEQEFHNKDHFPFKNGHLISNIRTNSSTINILVPVHGITVNKTSFD